MLFGAHVSIAGGIDKAPERAAAFGCEMFQVFSRPPQGGKPPAIDAEVVERLHAATERYGQKEFYIHTPYIINLASKEKRIAEGSVRIIKEELERGSRLGAQYAMTHIGSAGDREHRVAQRLAGDNLKRALEKEYKTKLLIEISAGAGNIIGDTFEELAFFMDYLKGYAIGICLDTQHMFASGYDLRDEEKVRETFDLFEKIVGFKHLRLFHLNDSKVDLGERKDRHEHLGDGKIGLSGFEALAAEKRLWPYNFVLETEQDTTKAGELLIVRDIRIMKELRAKYGD